MSARYEISIDELGCRAELTSETITCVMHFARHGGNLQERIADAVIRQQSADIAALKDALADEVTANEAFRKAGSARDDEDMPTFCARLIAERDKYRGQLFDCELALKMEHDLLCEKRAELAAAVAERDRLRGKLDEIAKDPIGERSTRLIYAAHSERDGLLQQLRDFTERAMKTIPPDWRPGYSWTDDSVMDVLAEYVGEIQQERDQLRAYKQAIDSAPVVAWVTEYFGDLVIESNEIPPRGTELIARPSKEST